MGTVFIGVDVGTSSVRAVAIDDNGHRLSTVVENLDINRPCPDYYEQSSEQIWEAVCTAVRKVVSNVDKGKYKVKGIGFDATCSLVILDRSGSPLSVSPCESPLTWDVIMWMDHRAVKQAERINATRHDRLKYAGQQVSPEMDLPKLLWLKENKPDTWKEAGHIMELADFLTFKACGSLKRSQCTVVCKCLYDANPGSGQWDWEFMSAIGLSDLKNSSIIGSDIRLPGTFCGVLRGEIAEQFCLPSRTDVSVAIGIIDAHAGVIGVLGTRTPNTEHIDIEHKLAIIAGTSTCHMALSKEKHFVTGVWGPYYGVVLDQYWLHEAGQNVVGPVLDEIAKQDCCRPLAEEHARLQREISRREQIHGPLAVAQLTNEFHVWPDYRGNRSPLADPNSKGAITGLRLKSDMDNEEHKLVTYLSHVQSFAYATRFIIDTLIASGSEPFTVIYLCGGLQNNSIYVQTHADVCQIPVIIPTDSDVVARGSAILGAYSTGKFKSLKEAMNDLSSIGTIVNPRKETFQYHKKKYKAFRLLGQTEAEIRRIMDSPTVVHS